jgi:hypothetical protein
LYVEATGDFIFSKYLGPYSLQVACSPDSSVTAVDFTGLQLVTVWAVNTAPGSIQTFTFPELVTNPTDCGIEKYAISGDGGSTFNESWTGALSKYPATGCATTPCRSMEVNVETARVITGLIKGYIIGGAIKVS